MIRFIIGCLIVFLYLVLTLPIAFILWLIGKKWPRVQDIVSLRMVQWAFRLILFVSGTKMEFRGVENIPRDTGVLYVGNHRSYFDILIAFAGFKDVTGFVAKKEMDRFPIFNLWMRYCHCLFLDRNDLRQGMEVIKTATEMVKNGISVFIFPEGTRNKNENETDLMEFHEGSFRVSYRSGCPVVPVVMHNTQKIFEAQFPRLVPQHVIIEYLPPIYPDTLSREEQKHMGASTRAKMQETLRKLNTK
ncbi:MAG: 1-acyl-sn-glycerol-3-phosphate acyltransferase [Blautia sp.]|nr:1-acyl-sn-glycerol-3-phosphate acyltransferase [Blautia sp.]